MRNLQRKYLTNQRIFPIGNTQQKVYNSKFKKNNNFKNSIDFTLQTFDFKNF